MSLSEKLDHASVADIYAFFGKQINGYPFYCWVLEEIITDKLSPKPWDSPKLWDRGKEPIWKLCYLEREPENYLEFSVFVLEEAFDVLSGKLSAWPWDFTHLAIMNAPLKPAWVYSKVHPLKIKLASDFETTMSPPLDTKIKRAHVDFQMQYGDGGHDYLAYPVYYSNFPTLSESDRIEFFLLMEDLTRRQGYRHESEPVEDLLDPDYNPQYPSKDFATRRLEAINFHKNRASMLKEHYPYDCWGWEFKYHIPPEATLRDTCQWVPTDFVVSSTGRVSIEGDIHNLPNNSENKSIYIKISQLFESMLPLFAKLNLFVEGESSRLQVITKIQRYNIQAGTSYSGHWHIEGKTENIVAVGVYYCQISSCLQGGHLEFRPLVYPDPAYLETPTCIVPVEEGSAVVFSNTLPHRFQDILNPGVEVGERLFITFFVVDPSQPIVCEKATYPEDPEAFRKQLKESLRNSTSAWGYANHGNCGDVRFLRDINHASQYNDGECSFHPDNYDPFQNPMS